MNIRKATPDDIPVMAEMLGRAFHHDPIVDWVFQDEGRRLSSSSGRKFSSQPTSHSVRAC